MRKFYQNSYLLQNLLLLKIVGFSMSNNNLFISVTMFWSDNINAKELVLQIIWLSCPMVFD